MACKLWMFNCFANSQYSISYSIIVNSLAHFCKISWMSVKKNMKSVHYYFVNLYCHFELVKRN